MIPNERIGLFGHLPSGAPVQRICLQHGALRANLLTYGATLQDLRLEGVAHPLVLGADHLASYLNDLEYVGAIVGRYAGRIADGQFEIEGTRHHLCQNDGARHCLHGGAHGSSHLNWTILGVAPHQARLGLTLPDGHMGFPGSLRIEACFTLTAAGALEISLSAQSTTPTPCSLAHHGYFNLDGSRSVADHSLWIDAAEYLQVDADLIPTGTVQDVAGSQIDFRTPRPIGTAPIDTTFCPSPPRDALRQVACLKSDKSHIAMRVETNQHGLHLYNGAHLSCAAGLGLERRAYAANAGLAFETQHWPDAPNHAQFPAAILRPEDTYRNHTIYRFEQI